MSVFTTAWRNLWRNRRRSLVTIAAMTLALLVMVLYSALLEGYLLGMENTITDLEMGDVQVFARGYHDKPSVFTTIEDPDVLLTELDAAGFVGSARLLAAGLAAAEESSAGAMLRGLDVSRDARVSMVYAHVADGEWLDPDQPDGVVVGRRLARTLGVKPGAEIVILTQAADGSLANDLYTVRGVLKSIGDATDRAVIFMTAGAFRELMVLPQGAHQIIVRRPEETALDAAGAAVGRMAGGYDVKTWHELLPTLADLMETQRSAMIILSLIVYVAIAIVILNAMLMAVFERIREFGVLKALGFGPLGVLRLILTESAIMALLAIAAALTLSVPALWYLSTTGIDLSALTTISVAGIAMDPVWRAAVTPRIFSAPVVSFVFIVTIAALYPALRAALLRPVEAMRHR